jgi:NifU homolog involved in Fe-S cluster formation
MDHFSNPRNSGKMISADGEGIVGDVRCGDSLTIYIKVKDNRITDIRFLVFGCAASIATSSMTTVLAKGKTLEEALKITEQDIIEALDGLPKIKYHCSNLGVTALRNAIKDYNEKRTKSVFQKILMFLSKHFYSFKRRIVFHMMYRFNKK